MIRKSPIRTPREEKERLKELDFKKLLTSNLMENLVSGCKFAG